MPESYAGGVPDRLNQDIVAAPEIAAEVDSLSTLRYTETTLCNNAILLLFCVLLLLSFWYACMDK